MFQRGIELAKRDGRRRSAHRLDHVHGYLVVHHPDFLALQIGRTFHRVYGVKAAAAAIEVAESMQPAWRAVAPGGDHIEHLGADRTVEHLPVMFFVTEQVRQAENLVGGDEIADRRGAGLGDIQGAGLDFFQALDFGPELFAGKDFDLQFPAREFLQAAFELFKSLVDRVAVGQGMGDFQDPNAGSRLVGGCAEPREPCARGDHADEDAEN